MKALLYSFCLLLSGAQMPASKQVPGIRLVVNNVRADAGNGNVYAGKKPGFGLLPDKTRDDVLVMDADVLRIIASYKLLELEKKGEKTFAKFYITYRVRYKKAKETRQAKTYTYELNEKNQFVEQEMIYSLPYNTQIRLTYTGTVIY